MRKDVEAIRAEPTIYKYKDCFRYWWTLKVWYVETVGVTEHDDGDAEWRADIYRDGNYFWTVTVQDHPDWPLPPRPSNILSVMLGDIAAAAIGFATQSDRLREQAGIDAKRG